MSWARGSRYRRVLAGVWAHVDFWKTLGYGAANERSRPASAPDRAWTPMGQRLGLPAARATTQEGEPRKHAVVRPAQAQLACHSSTASETLAPTTLLTPSAPDMAHQRWRPDGSLLQMHQPLQPATPHR
ncbi:hypothetical protein SNOG_10097 [Parastagonospora nodorum SN15]|uniref:Uncharacterized protein n=1 Tax=Phaeosphaeria nodorum (strain SN15 / ATCC MYA-4574 / FGSC 10173) TaxID=321614 RepID=Q0UDR7_PHANO|nr:hypothetical protein SNOG_10097 [Parastagonospora nodorum SN15]EAT82432.1 hypothetical protein SNOG_10097 [Parastagonospora nodorum SN15]